MAIAGSASELAARLRLAEESGVPCATFFRHDCKNLDLSYAIQRENTQHWIERGRRLVGRKIGLTDKRVQQKLGLAEPICGALFADMLVANNGEIPIDRVMAAKVEPELALVLDRDLNTVAPTSGDVISVVGSVLPALEIVGTRFQMGEATIADDVADNCGSGLFVLGAALPYAVDRVIGTLVMTVQGDGPEFRIEAPILSELTLTAVAWLARKMASQETPLRAGDVIMTGALTNEVAVDAGLRVTAAFAGHEPVVVSFVAGRRWRQ